MLLDIKEGDILVMVRNQQKLHGKAAAEIALEKQG